MALQDCPKMTAKCPHRAPNCSTSDGDDCHYVKSALATSAFSRGLTNFLTRAPRADAYLHSEPAFRPSTGLERLAAEMDLLAIERRNPNFHIE